MKAIAVIVGILVGLYFASSGGEPYQYGVQATSNETLKNIVAIGAAIAGVWLLKTGTNTFAQFGGLALACGGVSCVIGNLVIPTQPVPPAYQQPGAPPPVQTGSLGVGSVTMVV